MLGRTMRALALLAVSVALAGGCKQTIIVGNLAATDSSVPGADSEGDAWADDAWIEPPPLSVGTLFYQVGQGAVVRSIVRQCTCLLPAAISPLGNPQEVVACRNACVEITAHAEGGLAPYAYRWSDGETNPSRSICSSGPSTFTVTVSASNGESATAALEVVPAGCCPSTLGEASPGLEMTSGPAHFASDALLAPGSYQVRYLDGCIKSGSNNWNLGLRVANPLNIFNPAFAVVTSSQTLDLPTTNLTYETPEACIEANRGLQPLRFEHEGGQVGLTVKWPIGAPFTPITATVPPPRWELIVCD